MQFRALIVMGPMGAGKSTLGAKLAAALTLPFIDADDFHAPASVANMRAGLPLSDAERAPWLARVGMALRDGGVAACSALARRHRDALRAAAGRDLLFVYLDTPRAELERRLAARQGHFASPALLDSQLATLEPPQPDEHAIVVRPDEPFDSILARCRAA